MHIPEHDTLCGHWEVIRVVGLHISPVDIVQYSNVYGHHLEQLRGNLPLYVRHIIKHIFWRADRHDMRCYSADGAELVLDALGCELVCCKDSRSRFHNSDILWLRVEHYVAILEVHELSASTNCDCQRTMLQMLQSWSFTSAWSRGFALAARVTAPQ
jgi:hypothetical protein